MAAALTPRPRRTHGDHIADAGGRERGIGD
jgi:hypothetical protein